MPHVLVAHTSVGGRALLDRVFKRFGQHRYPTTIVSSPAEALDIASQTPPDLALLDTTYESMSGFDLVDKLRGMYPNLPIMIWALHISEEQRAQASNMQLLIVQAWPVQHDFYSGLNRLLKLA